MNNKVMAFAGRKRSGKTMMATAIKENYDNGIVLSVANQLKYLCCEILNINFGDLISKKDNGYKFNIKPDEKWFNIISQRTGIDYNIIKDEIGNVTFGDVRQVLQVIGTDLIRKYNPEWHIDKTIEQIKANNDKIILIDDVRFPNEIEKLRDIGAKVVFVIRPFNFSISNHVSETSVTWKDFNIDDIIINDKSKNYVATEIVKWFNDDMQGKCALATGGKYVRNSDFGVEKTELVKKIARQNDNDVFRKYGIIRFNTCNLSEAKEYISKVDKSVSYLNEKCNSFSTYNPLITENLKKHMKDG